MDPANITDEETLRTWLETRPREDAVQIAHRAAMRVLPVFWEWSLQSEAGKADVTALLILRANLIAGIAGTCPTPAISRAALDVATATVSTAPTPAAYAGRARAAAANAVRAGADVAVARAAYPNAVVPVGTYAARAAVEAAYTVAVWSCVRPDAAALAANEPLERRPLWPDDNPLAETWAATKARLSDDPDDWSFWIGWYDAALKGIPPDWALLEKIALIPSEDWDKGPAHLNALIAGIVEAHERPARPDPETIRIVQQAVARNRETLPLQLDALAELIAQEHERIRGRNSKDEAEQAEKDRVLDLFSRLGAVVARLRELVPEAGAPNEAEAEEMIGLGDLFKREIKAWPRTNAAEIVDTTYRLVFGGAAAGVFAVMGLPMLATAVGGIIVGGRQIARIGKVAKDAGGGG